MDYQQPHGYMRPPPPPPAPPSAADPFQRPPAPVPPPPSNHPWPYSAPQFHYQPQTQHSPSPPPPQWPPPHSSDHTQYPQHPPPPPYPAHQPPPYSAHPHYPPPPPLPPRAPHVQSYSQDWGSGGWTHHQSWQYPTNNNEEDWAAKAKAWAAAKSATDNQHTPSQFLPAGRPEEQNHFHDHYSQPMDPQFLDVHTSLAPSSNYNQYPVAMPPSNRSEVAQLQDSQYMNSGQSSYAAATHVPFAGRDGGAGDSFPLFQQEKSPISSLVHQQEVPSSYSSVPGSGDSGDRYEKFNSSSVPVHSLPHHHIHQGRSGWMEEPHHLRGSQPAASVTDLSDQPLSFAPHFHRDPDAHVQPSYAHPSGGPARGGDPTVGMSSNYAWAPSSAPGTAYPPGPPTMPLGAQVDHPINMTSPASGHSAPMFPPGPGFQPTVPMIGAAFGVGAGVTPHPTAFPGDAYGIAERPKKASVPNWLREEIIKKKTVITSSAPDLPKEDSQSNEDDNNDRSSRKGDQADSKSIESSRSTEDEDEDEDEVEAARTAAINKEIKRVLTEVLLKVTDDLFDEIATKVLKEDDLSVEVGRDTDLSNPPILPSAPSVLTPKASAKVLIPTKTKENDNEDASDKSASGSRGDVLGLASYASDEDDDDMQSSGKPNPKESSKHPQSSSNKLLEGNTAVENGGSLDKAEEERTVPAKLETNGTGRNSVVNASSDCSVAFVDSIDNMAATETASTGNQHSSKRLSGSAENELQHDSNTSKSSSSLTEKFVEKNERPDGNLHSERWINEDSRVQNSGDRSDKNDRLESKKSLVKKDHKDSENSKGRLDKKGDEEQRRREDRRGRMGRSEHYDNSKDKGKEKGRTGDNIKNSESRKHRSPSDDKEGTTETQRAGRTSNVKDSNEKRKDRAGDEKKERSRHKSGGESGGHKRRSSSVDARDKEGKDNSVPSHANASSDESSDDSKRKSNHSRRHRSPSPSRRRKRQVSRSPHSKHSKRRHSPYSSLETTRGRRSPSRSRSRSPVHRRR